MAAVETYINGPHAVESFFWEIFWKISWQSAGGWLDKKPATRTGKAAKSFFKKVLDKERKDGHKRCPRKAQAAWAVIVHWQVNSEGKEEIFEILYAKRRYRFELESLILAQIERWRRA